MASKINILVSDPVDSHGVGLLKANPNFNVVENKAADGLDHYQAWLVRSETKITKDALAKAKNLKLVGRAGTGVDNIDVAEATKRGVLVINVPGANAISVAELAMSLMLACVRKIAAADKKVKSGGWRDKSLAGRELYGKTLGLIGFGRVGREVARRAAAFNMKVIAYDPFLSETQAAETGVSLAGLEELLAASDVISLHTALTEQTRNLIGEKTLSKMKKGAILINTSRGEVVDEAALAVALKSGHLSSCGLDVFSKEPPQDSPLLSLGDQVVLTPHLGASTQESQTRVGKELAQSVIDYFEQGLLRGCVNLPPGFEPEVLEKLGNHIRLAEKMGRFLGQYLDGPWKIAEFRAWKAVSEKERRVLLQAALRGIMSCALGDEVNLVNAAVFSKERGVNYSTSGLEEGSNTELALTLTSENGTASVTGRVEADGAIRLQRVGQLSVGVTPEGTLVTLENKDKPGMIGKVGTLLGQKGVNIADMRVGRTQKGDHAIMVLTIDGEVPKTVLQALSKIEGITRVRLIQL